MTKELKDLEKKFIVKDHKDYLNKRGKELLEEVKRFTKMGIKVVKSDNTLIDVIDKEEKSIFETPLGQKALELGEKIMKHKDDIERYTKSGGEE